MMALPVTNPGVNNDWPEDLGVIDDLADVR